MFITNPEKIPKAKMYLCNETVAMWLIYKKHLPLFSLKDGVYGFAKTEALDNALKDMGIVLKVLSVF